MKTENPEINQSLEWESVGGSINPGEIVFALGDCWLGRLLLAVNGQGLCLLAFGDDGGCLEQELSSRFPKAHLLRSDGRLMPILAKVVAFLDAPEKPLDLPLAAVGTGFQQRVWQALQGIPPGATRSYSEIALCIGAPKAVRAVASACAANPLAVIVPCHRVLRRDGGLSGYRWGVGRKRALLGREALVARPGDDIGFI